jgi:hypothetical protein
MVPAYMLKIRPSSIKYIFLQNLQKEVVQTNFMQSEKRTNYKNCTICTEFIEFTENLIK